MGNPLKALYFALEDRYYAVLDKVPALYKIAEPIDKAVPSFLLFICFVVLIAALCGLFLLEGFGETYSIKVTVIDLESKQPLAGAKINYVLSNAGGATIADSKTTGPDGTILVEGLSGEYEAGFAAEKDGYNDYSKDFVVSKESNIFELKLAALAGERMPVEVVLKDAETRDAIKIESGNRAELRFSCTNDAVVPNKYKASPRFTILPSEIEACAGVKMAVSVENQYSQSDWSTLEESPVVFYLEPRAKTASKARVTVTVKDADTGDGVSGIIVKLLDEEQGEKGVGLTGALGKFEFKPPPGTYKIYASDSSSGYESNSSGTFTVEKDESKSIAIQLNKVLPADQKMLKILVRDEATKEPIAGAKVLVSENAVLLDEKETSSDGKVHYNASKANGYSVMATHAEYVAYYSSISVVSANETAYTMVDLQKLELDEDGNPTNAGGVKVAVKDQKNEAQGGALVSLYREGYSVLPQKAEASSKGEVFYNNLPPGEYHASAVASDGQASGKTDTQELRIGQLLEFNIVLLIGSAPIYVTVQNNSGRPVGEARVSFVDRDTNEVIEQTLTDERGKTERVEVKVSQKPVIKAEKDGFWSSSIALDRLEKGVRQDVLLVLYEEGSVQELTLLMSGCLAKKDSFRQASPQRMLSSSGEREPKEYRLVFEVVVPHEQENIIVNVRTDSDSVEIVGDARLYVMGFSEAYSGIRSSQSSPENPFSNLDGVTDSSLPAKQANITLGDLSPGAYRFYALVQTKNDLADGTPLEVHYAIKSDTAATTNLAEVFLVNEPTPCTAARGNFSYSFFISKAGEAQKTRLEEFDGTATSLENRVQAGAEYTVEYFIRNTSRTAFAGAQAQILEVFDADTVLNPFPGAVEIPSLPPNGTASGEFAISPSTSTEATPKLEFKITEDDSAAFLFNVLGEKQMLVSVSPEIPVNSPELAVFARDAETGALLDGLVYCVVDEESTHPTTQEFLNNYTGTAGLVGGVAILDLAGSYTTANVLHIYIVVPEYEGYAHSINFSDTITSELQELFQQCITAEFESNNSTNQTVPYNLNESISVSTSECPGQMQIQLNSVEGLSISPSEFSLGATGSKTQISVSPVLGSRTGKHVLGQFPIWVSAKLAGSSDSFVPALSEELKLIVSRKSEISSAQDCFWIQDGKFEYNLSSEGGSGVLLNDCCSSSALAGFPKLFTGLFGVAVSSARGTVPENAVGFNWNIKAKARIFHRGESTKAVDSSKSFEVTSSSNKKTWVEIAVQGIEDVGKIRLSRYHSGGTIGYLYDKHFEIKPAGEITGEIISVPDSGWSESTEQECSYPFISGECTRHVFETDFSAPKNITQIKVRVDNMQYTQMVFTLFGKTVGEPQLETREVEFTGGRQEARIAVFSPEPENLGELSEELFSKAKIYNVAGVGGDVAIKDLNIWIEADNPNVAAWIGKDEEGNTSVFAKYFGASSEGQSTNTPFVLSGAGLEGEQYGYLTVEDLVELEGAGS